jgi:RNA polymerase sigma-70 factor (ECF subfamily)
MEEKLLSILPEIKRFAFSLTGNRDDALDLVQDTCLKAIKHKDKCDGVNFKAWVFTICKNSFINDYRREKKQIIDFTPDLYYLNQSQEKLETEYNAKELQMFINQVSDINRIPFQMHIDGYQYDEIATILGIKLGTVKSRIFFARQQIMQDIKNDNLKPINIEMEKEKLIIKFREIYHQVIKDGKLNKSGVVKETGLFWTTLDPLLEGDINALIVSTRKVTFEKMQAFCDKHNPHKSVAEDQKESSLEKKEPENKCPFGHTFGIANDNFVDCDTCLRWVECMIHKGNEEPKSQKIHTSKTTAQQENDKIFWEAIHTAFSCKPENVNIHIEIK